jgi:maleate cis-trans isomerase
MFGWRAKIGLIVPSRNVVMEPEFSHFVPPGVSVHTSRMFRTVPDVAVATQMEMMGYAEEAPQLVARARQELIQGLSDQILIFTNWLNFHKLGIRMDG